MFSGSPKKNFFLHQTFWSNVRYLKVRILGIYSKLTKMVQLRKSKIYALGGSHKIFTTKLK